MDVTEVKSAQKCQAGVDNPEDASISEYVQAPAIVHHLSESQKLELVNIVHSTFIFTGLNDISDEELLEFVFASFDHRHCSWNLRPVFTTEKFKVERRSLPLRQEPVPMPTSQFLTNPILRSGSAEAATSSLSSECNIVENSHRESLPLENLLSSAEFIRRRREEYPAIHELFESNLSDMLIPQNLATYEILFQWRRSYAKRLEVEPNFLVSTEKLVALANVRPDSKSSLKKITGLNDSIVITSIRQKLLLCSLHGSFLRFMDYGHIECNNCFQNGHLPAFCPFQKQERRIHTQNPTFIDYSKNISTPSPEQIDFSSWSPEPPGHYNDYNYSPSPQPVDSSSWSPEPLGRYNHYTPSPHLIGLSSWSPEPRDHHNNYTPYQWPLRPQPCIPSNNLRNCQPGRRFSNSMATTVQSRIGKHWPVPTAEIETNFDGRCGKGTIHTSNELVRPANYDAIKCLCDTQLCNILERERLALFEHLFEWRKFHGQANGILPDNVISTAKLVELANVNPETQARTNSIVGDDSLLVASIRSVLRPDILEEFVRSRYAGQTCTSCNQEGHGELYCPFRETRHRRPVYYGLPLVRHVRIIGKRKGKRY